MFLKEKKMVWRVGIFVVGAVILSVGIMGYLLPMTGLEKGYQTLISMTSGMLYGGTMMAWVMYGRSFENANPRT